MNKTYSGKLEFNTSLFSLEEKYANAIHVISDTVVVTTPLDLDENYWLFRVAVSDVQAIVCFPKFYTFGVGFQYEEDWNTNLPYTCDADEIYNHIKHNKGDKNISDEICIDAIRLIQKACAEFEGSIANK